MLFKQAIFFTLLSLAACQDAAALEAVEQTFSVPEASPIINATSFAVVSEEEPAVEAELVGEAIKQEEQIVEKSGLQVDDVNAVAKSKSWSDDVAFESSSELEGVHTIHDDHIDAILAAPLPVLTEEEAKGYDAEAHAGHCRPTDRRKYALGSGWENFYFGKVGCKTVDFVIDNPSGGEVTIDVTDLRCSGDILRVVVNGKNAGLTSLPKFDKCKRSTTDPEVAFYDDQWSSLSTSARGHKIFLRFEVEDSPYKEGVAAFRAYKMRTKCPLQVDGLTIINTPVSHKNAGEACAAFGLELANIKSQTFESAAKVVFGCLGSHAKAWIGSWNGDHYQGAPIAYSVGAWARGNINTYPKDEAFPVLCEGEVRDTKIFLRS